MTRADRLRHLNGQPLIHEMLSQWSETPGLPIGVIAPASSISARISLRLVGEV
jgi:hypothetical protein